MSLLPQQTPQPPECVEAPLQFHLRTEASPAACRAVVHAAMRIVSENILDESLLHLFQLAVFEACANVVCHAYPDGGPGPLEVELRVEPGVCIEAEVRDQGCGFEHLPTTISLPPPEADSGRGLYIISKAADDYEFSQDAEGVTVRIRKNMENDQWIPYE